MTSSASATRIQFEGIESSAFQHPLDRQATDNLKLLVGFDLLVAKFLEFGYERSLYVYNIASSVKVGPRQFPQLYEMLRETCTILDVTEPEMYVYQTPIVNAHTFGHTKPYIVLNSGLLDLMNEDETRAIIAHEVGHIKCGHVLYITMANILANLTIRISESSFGIGLPAFMVILCALLNWRRRAELSADRAAL